MVTVERSAVTSVWMSFNGRGRTFGLVIMECPCCGGGGHLKTWLI